MTETASVEDSPKRPHEMTFGKNNQIPSLEKKLPALEWLKSISISTHLTLGMLLRLILIAYGQHQDETMEVLYTDVDYKVFTDAARHVYEGGSPYERHTYRYSPLLAWLMVPNIVWSPNLGKLIFVLCDIFAGHLIYNILK